MKPYILLTVVLSIGLSACHKHTNHAQKVSPAKVEKIEGSSISKVTLTADAERRLGIETIVPELGGSNRGLVPLSALLYDTKGTAWLFARSSEHVYQRIRVEVLDTLESQVRVSGELPRGGAIVTQGVAELYVAAFGAGK